jgi:hypothetical protein
MDLSTTVAARAQSHDRAFTTNAADPAYRQLSTARTGQSREMAIPSGRRSARMRETGHLPAVSGWSRPRTFPIILIGLYGVVRCRAEHSHPQLEV